MCRDGVPRTDGDVVIYRRQHVVEEQRQRTHMHGNRPSPPSSKVRFTLLPSAPGSNISDQCPDSNDPYTGYVYPGAPSSCASIVAGWWAALCPCIR